MSGKKYIGPTVSPESDAARFESQQEAADEFRQEAERQAPLIVLKALQGIKTPADWFEDARAVHGWHADEMLRHALDYDDDTISAHAELVTKPTPGTKQKLFQCIAAWFGERYAVEIYTAHLEDQK